MIWLSYFAMILLLLIGTLLIFIILLQRGRGGGLAGALGGMGGQSAFGTKAGDMFTRITVVLAVIWIVLCAGQIPLLRAVSSNRYVPGSAAPDTLEAAPLKDGAALDDDMDFKNPPVTDQTEKEDAEKESLKLPAAKTKGDQPSAEKSSPESDPSPEKSDAEQPAEKESKEPPAEKPPAEPKPDADPEK